MKYLRLLLLWLICSGATWLCHRMAGGAGIRCELVGIWVMVFTRVLA